MCDRQDRESLLGVHPPGQGPSQRVPPWCASARTRRPYLVCTMYPPGQGVPTWCAPTRTGSHPGVHLPGQGVPSWCASARTGSSYLVCLPAQGVPFESTLQNSESLPGVFPPGQGISTWCMVHSQTGERT